MYYSLTYFPARALNSCYRGLATEAVASTETTSTGPPPPVKPRPKQASRPILHTSVILNRSPILTRTPSFFERAFYAYQARIRRALHNPFPYEFYFKQGSLLEAKFNLEERQRDRTAFGREFGADSRNAPGAKLTAEDLKKFGQAEDESTVSRKHASDETGDVKSLDRKGQRNLYLLVQRKENGRDVWGFPQGKVEEGELLHQVRLCRIITKLSMNFAFQRLRVVTFLHNAARVWTPGSSAESR